MWWIVSLAAAAVPTGGTWTELQENPVKIECTDAGGKPYCRSTGVIGVPVDVASATFEKLDEHVSKMGAISSMKRLEPDVLHIVMDYPFPFKDRDYVARFTPRIEADGTKVYAWSPLTHEAAPDTGDTIRLTWLDGEWRFRAEGQNTRVTYVWEADPGGDMPDVGAVRKQAGTLAIKDMASACGTKVVAP